MTGAQQKVAFLGLGRMGRLMAGHVLDAGRELTVWNRSPGKADELRSRGAREASSPADAVAGAEAIVLMLFGGDSVAEVLDQLGGAAPAGALMIDATTTGPEAARRLGAKARQLGLRYIDAPVAGSLAPAREGTLAIFVGGDASDVEAAWPLLALWGDPAKIRHIGPVGSANALKAVVNMCLGLAMAGVGEALELASDLQLDEAVVLDALGTGPFGWTLSQKRSMIESSDYSQTTFSLDLMAKDLTLALSSAEHELPLTADALARAKQRAAEGHADEDYAAMAIPSAATPEAARRR
jgi:3-hydroxyisobutyrate dehydrogenase-like beta-hydroxyacid dehydrogenase